MDSTDFADFHNDKPLGAPIQDIASMAAADKDRVDWAGGANSEAPKSGNVKHDKIRRRAVHIVQGSAKIIAKAVIGIDKVAAKAGHPSSRSRLGAIPMGREPQANQKDDIFVARYLGQEGFAFITPESQDPCLCWCAKTSHDEASPPPQALMDPAWSVPIRDVVKLNKYHGFGTKSKLIVGWALKVEVNDGLEIVGRSDSHWLLTALARRDELFNRACAIGDQRWEIL
jgi:hypothetical protein